jgi:predicted metal-dependent HD superfamily phosphohydrolase
MADAPESRISPERLAALEGSFARLLKQYGVPEYDAYPIFDDLANRHSEPHRHYHTLEHVAEVLRVVGRLSRFAADPNAVLLAAWFHDAVYDPHAKDNEEQSVIVAAESMDLLYFSPELQAHVWDLIRSTAHSTHLESPDPDTAVLLDADLAILAAEEKRYARYAEDVRKEYAWVPDDAYRTGRTDVLQSFLARPRIYNTPVMVEEGEESARRNLRAEIERLQQAV